MFCKLAPSDMYEAAVRLVEGGANTSRSGFNHRSALEMNVEYGGGGWKKNFCELRSMLCEMSRSIWPVC
jgi:hypothetical protein